VWNSKVLVTIRPALAMSMHGSQEDDFWAAKGKQIESQVRNIQEWERERVCRGGVAAWGPAVRKSTHPFL
jgi:hypothetical protein